MGLRCTVLGHAWSDPQIEREREESDAEVVTTVREYKECERCGDREVLSENVEVTAQASAGDTRPDDAEPETATDDAMSDDGPGGGADAPEAPDRPEGAVIEDAETGEPTVVEDAGDAAGDDDAVILDDDPAQDREPGTWPDHDEPEEPDVEPGPWPDHDGEPAEGGLDDGGAATPPDPEDHATEEAAHEDAAPTDEAAGDAADVPLGVDEADEEPAAEEGEPASGPPASEPREPPADEAVDTEPDVVAAGEEDDVEVIRGGESGGAADADGAGGDPDPEPDMAADAEAGMAADADADTDADGESVDPAEVLTEAAEGQAADEEAVEPTVESDVEMTVYCPDCGFVVEGSNPSLRGGDSCPQCQKAYLAERES